MGSICLIHNLLSGGAKARAIAPEPLNIYLGMQVCYQGQTASTLPSQQSHLPPWGGGGGRSDSEEKEDRKRKRGGCKDTATFFFGVFLSACVPPHSCRGQSRRRRRRHSVNSPTFFLFFLSLRHDLRDHGKRSLVACFFRHLLKLHVSVSSLRHNSSITIPTWRQRPI